jgi:6-pyruvoyltetrahydropterin/6-carboxytetrahydropterin synthase
MYEAVLTETFRASHALEDLRPTPHWHEWVVKITIQSETLLQPGIIINYYELKPLLKSILPEGQDLNTSYVFAPTAENLARHFYETLKPQLASLYSVSVGEFEAFMCTYYQN